jgi:hypothetical protein
MNKYDKIRNFCKTFRITLGSALIAVAVVTGINWFYLGIIPLVAGSINFCPLCVFSKKCTIQ